MTDLGTVGGGDFSQAARSTGPGGDRPMSTSKGSNDAFLFERQKMIAWAG